MKNPSRQIPFKSVFIKIVFIIAALTMNPALARVVEDVDVGVGAEGYEIRLNFNIPLRYQNHTPQSFGSDIRIQFRPGFNIGQCDDQALTQLSGRETLDWNRASNAPIIEILYEGVDPQNPDITLRFDQVVSFEVRGSADLRSLVILLKPEMDDIVGAQAD